jgi:hypothetical protein
MDFKLRKMNQIMKKIRSAHIIYLSVVIVAIFLYSCMVPKSILDKSGAQLWGENCQRCHNVPPPTVYTDDQWVVLIKHMKIRSNITSDEADKIRDFIQAAN